MRLRALAYLWAVFASYRAAFAQAPADDWTNFPKSSPTRSEPAPEKKAAPATPPAPRGGPDIGAPQGAAKPSPDDAVVVREQILPGAEPHSPSTLGISYQDRRTFRYTPSTGGSLGVLHVLSADLGRKGLLRFSATGEYFSGRDFPVKSATDTRSAGTFAISYVLLDFLELYTSYAASANTNSNSSPQLISSLGDISVGGKAAQQFARGFYAGIDLRITSYSSVGRQDVRSYAIGFAPKLIATYNLREAFPKVPLRMHGNLGAVLDSTRTLPQSQPLNAAEQFALNINRYQRLVLGLGIEAPLTAVTPFVEYNLAFPLSSGVLVGPDGVLVSRGRVLPHAFSLGVKVTAIKDLTLTAAIDLGLSRMVALGIPATMPYNLIFGAAFNVDPFLRSETKVVEKTQRKPENEPPKTGKVAGVILDGQTKKPVPGAIVAMVGAGVPPVASDADSGAFLSHELPAGPLKLSAQKDGYRAAEQEVILEAGKTSNVELILDALVRKARFAISVTSKRRPISASVSLKGPEEQQVPITAASEAVKVETTPGKYLVNVTAPGHLAQTREVQVSDSTEMALTFDLAPKPRRRLVMVRENKIEILQQVHFAPGKTTILADSFPLLAQLVDVIVKSGIKRLRIEGHTDNRGNKKTNLQISEERASAVADYLEQSGIDRSRLETAGYGDTRPVAPNLTARGRELNRRVELIILEK